MITRVLCVLLLLGLGGRAAAATLDGATLPDSYTVDGQVLPLNGIGVRTLTIFNVRVYVAGLYLPRPSHDAQAILNSAEPKVVLLHFLHSGSKAEIEKEYRLGEANNCGHGGCAPADAVDFDRLVAAAPAVGVGDTSTFIFTRSGVRVLANNQPIAESSNLDMAYHLLSGFIGEHPPSAALRSSLLGLAQD